MNDHDTDQPRRGRKRKCRYVALVDQRGNLNYHASSGQDQALEG